MNTDIACDHDSFKAQQGPTVNPSVEIVRTIGALPINPTAKLVGMVMRSTRIFDSRQLAEITGLSMRVIQKSKNDYVAALDEAGELGFAEWSEPGERSEPGFANGTNPANQDSLSTAPRVHAPAQKELPSGVSSCEEVASKAREEVTEIPGLNGSTFRYVDMLAGWLAGDLRPKEPDVAHAILAGNVEHYGADQVKAGMLELQAAIGAGQRPRDPGKAFSGFVKNAKPPRSAEPPKLSKIDEQIAKARALMSPQARADAEARNGRLAS